ncbi:NADP-dependent oxidoreductase domain-containing protein 1-like isoform X1 [Physella acuta]|uniref:NADP-dependent oxidoreductase domain-containing protein 1-like isoform X1 n=1 Tax=Physella acuta TaxID=109671 RepID=UPI0027DCCAB2|nr:NADP-dependent oxidoreductase domain-containing protein 1-like isoform X1 [Physella acuta]
MALSTISCNDILRDNDITCNLPSLRFESAVDEKGSDFLPLRKKSHAIVVTQCAAVSVMIDILRKAKSLIQDFPKPERKTPTIETQPERKTPTIETQETRKKLIVGLIGCGRLGFQLTTTLLTNGRLDTDCVQISTRRPELLDHLKQQGVACYFDNKKLVAVADVIVLCVLPSQVASVAAEVSGQIPASSILISLCAGLPARRLRQLLETSNIICPNFEWSDVVDSRSFKWAGQGSVSHSLDDQQTVLRTCPYAVAAEGALLRSNEKLMEVLILSVVNICLQVDLSTSETLSVVSQAVFGESQPMLTARDFGLWESRKNIARNFSSYDLVDGVETPVLKLLKDNQSLQTRFSARYWQLFSDYIHKRNFLHLR